MGPFELMDLIGLDVNFAVTKSVWEGFFRDPRYAPSVRQQELVAAGWLGRKSGRGFYDYAPQAVKPVPRTEPAQAAPAKITLHGDAGLASPLVDRIAAAGVAIEHARSDSRFPAGAFHIAGKAGGAWLALTDGRTATARFVRSGVRDLVLFDLANDYATASRLALARADTCSDDAWNAAVGVLFSGRYRGQPSRRCRRPRRHAHRLCACQRGGRRRRAGRCRCRSDRSGDAEEASTIRAGLLRGETPLARRRYVMCSPTLSSNTAKTATGSRRW